MSEPFKDLSGPVWEHGRHDEPEKTPALVCGRYELRQGPDAMLICYDTVDEIEFVVTETNLSAFMTAGMILLGIDYVRKDK